jgi:hypothetical protein
MYRNMLLVTAVLVILIVFVMTDVFAQSKVQNLVVLYQFSCTCIGKNIPERDLLFCTALQTDSVVI